MLQMCSSLAEKTRLAGCLALLTPFECRETVSRVVGRRSDDERPKNEERTASAVVESLGLRLIDRGHPITFVVFCALVLLGIVAWRMPEAALGRVPDALFGFLEHENFAVAALALSTILFAVTSGLLVGVVVFQRRTYRAEIDRMADYIRRLETRLDAERPATYVGDATSTAVVKEQPKPLAKTKGR